VANVNGEVADRLVGRSFSDLAELDAALIELDGTTTKSRLGANAVRRRVDGRGPCGGHRGRDCAVAVPPRKG